MHCRRRTRLTGRTTIGVFLILVSLGGCAREVRSPPSDEPVVAPQTAATQTIAPPAVASAREPVLSTSAAVQSPPVDAPIEEKVPETAVSTSRPPAQVAAASESTQRVSSSKKAKPASAKSAAAVPGAVTATTGTATPPTAAKVSKPVVAKPVEAPTLDMASLEQRLRDTRAIGVFTKLSLKNQVDDLLEQFRAYHKAKSKMSLAELRERYNLLLLKVLTLLQDDDAPLAAAISSSRDAIWAILMDPKQSA